MPKKTKKRHMRAKKTSEPVTKTTYATNDASDQPSIPAASRSKYALAAIGVIAAGGAAAYALQTKARKMYDLIVHSIPDAATSTHQQTDGRQTDGQQTDGLSVIDSVTKNIMKMMRYMYELVKLKFKIPTLEQVGSAYILMFASIGKTALRVFSWSLRRIEKHLRLWERKHNVDLVLQEEWEHWVREDDASFIERWKSDAYNSLGRTRKPLRQRLGNALAGKRKT
jgi:hypothetical protein